VGRDIISTWATSLPKNAAVLDVGAGFGEPVTRALCDAGCKVAAIDPSQRMVAAFRKGFPEVPIACEPVEQSTFHGRKFDGIVMIGVLFLLAPARQPAILKRLVDVLRPGGQLLFTAPKQAGTWNDMLTGRPSWGLGRVIYEQALKDAGCRLIGLERDAGRNTYYLAEQIVPNAEVRSH